MTIQFTQSTGGPPQNEQGARQVMNCLRSRFSAAFQDEMILLTQQLLGCDVGKARVVYLAPQTVAARLNLVGELVSLEVSDLPGTDLLRQCVQELARIDRWVDVELGDDAPLEEGSLRAFLWQMGRCFCIYEILRAICGEPVSCSRRCASINEVRQWQAYAFGVPFFYGDLFGRDQ